MCGYDNNDTKLRIIHIEYKKKRILKEREETWRLRSHAIWLQAGDDNTNFFLQYSRARGEINIIWSLHDEGGYRVANFRDLENFGVR